ncbi:unnamed protein product [Cuscuta europaea]|uniref:Protein kinase domain-containing protein n=1 Tax=Cuscuta europaea TaxID=41803 RepID=A0A9P0YUT4_CUSEU|nr:unnamed protein product [Cuscuta europaea]
MDQIHHSSLHARWDLPLPGSAAGERSGEVRVETRIRMKQGGTDDDHQFKRFEARTSQPGFTCISAYVAIGTIGRRREPGITVYKAAVAETTITEWESGNSYQTSVSKSLHPVKVADNPKAISILREEVRRSYGVKGSHPNLLQVRDSLTVTASYDGTKCYAVAPRDDYTHGAFSVRSIVRKHGGFQGREDLILCVLRSILNALCFLHKQRIPHGDISAGHVYLTPHPPLPFPDSFLKLGFAATLFHEDDEFAAGTSNSALLPMPSISQWAAAPELVASHTNNYEQPSEKADIWLVGITALELAYGAGGLQLPNRNALEAMVKDILHNNKLPPTTNGRHKQLTIETEQQVIKTEHTNLLKHYAKKLGRQCSASSSSPFSSAFTSMVIQCLAWDPLKRPTAHKLLSHKFFQKNFPGYEDDGKYFYDHVVINEQPYNS